MKAITERDITGQPLEGKTVAILGYGNQGEAQALNLRDSGVAVVVGLRPGSRSRERVEADGIPALDCAEASAAGDVIALMVPDDAMPAFVRDVVAPRIRRGSALLFAHGFALRYGTVVLPEGVDIVMVAPMGPGIRLRERFLEGGGLPGSFSVERDVTGTARRTALEYAKAIGCARVGIFETTAADETEIDLFSEQAVLVGGVTRLIVAGFDTLVEAGYDPELAYLECLYELDLTVNLIHRYGISGMRERISRTALFGDLTRGDRVIGPEVRQAMRAILEEVRDGTFAAELFDDERSGGPRLRQALAKERGKLLEEVARKLRSVAHAPRVGSESA
jgi:ketol-acid reductoisomerase